MDVLDRTDPSHVFECEYVFRTTSFKGSCVQWVYCTGLVPVTCMSANMCLEIHRLRVSVSTALLEGTVETTAAVPGIRTQKTSGDNGKKIV